MRNLTDEEDRGRRSEFVGDVGIELSISPTPPSPVPEAVRYRGYQGGQLRGALAWYREGVGFQCDRRRYIHCSRWISGELVAH